MRRLYGLVCGLFLLLVGTWPASSSAQILPLYDALYRPPGISYRVFRSDRFEVIYQVGHEKQAQELLRVLNETLPGADSLIGTTSTFRLSTVLNGFNDRPNGYVTPFPFKTEIEATAIKSRSLSPRHASWMEIVGAHELVHAVHGDFHTGTGITGLIHRFAPDVARAANFWTPPGFTEGLAVLHESRLRKGAGRLNHPYFVMQFRAGMAEGGGWSLAEMLEQPSFTRPFDRFYKGGSLFTRFLEEEYGKETIHRLIRSQYQVPFLGYGLHLKRATGDYPWTIGSNVRRWQREREERMLSTIGPILEGTMISGRDGLIQRRPRWISDTEIVLFGLGYNLSRGFYRISASGGKLTKISRQEISEDVVWSFSPDTTEILFSRYEPNRYSFLKDTAQGFTVDLESGESRRIRGSAHSISPVKLRDKSVLALRNDGQFNEVVQISPGGESEPVLKYPRSFFRAVAPRPHSDSLAVLLNVSGHQALFLTTQANGDQMQLRPWIGFEYASIYDAAWSSSGNYLTFTADRDGVMNVYVLDARTERIWQATNARYGAMEPSMSPDESRIAFVTYGDERFDLNVIPFRPTSSEQLRRDDANYTWLFPWREELAGKTFGNSGSAQTAPYRAWRHLVPRMVYPTIYLDSERRTPEDARLGLGVGVALQGSDPLQKITYYGEAVVQKRRPWGELGISSAVLPVRMSASVSRRPDIVQAVFLNDANSSSSTRLVRDRSRVSAGLRLPITLYDNVSRSSLVSVLHLNGRRDRFLDDDLEVAVNERKHLTLSPGVFYAHRVNSRPRDLFPTSGLSFRWFGEFDLVSEGPKKEWAWVIQAIAYLPILSSTNTGIRLNAGLLNQNSPSVFGLDFFKPRGWEDAFLNEDAFMRYGLDVVQPVKFIDNGFLAVPLYLKSIFLYGFAEHLHRFSDFSDSVTSAGGGIGIQWRLFYQLNFETRFGISYRFDDKSWVNIGDIL